MSKTKVNSKGLQDIFVIASNRVVHRGYKYFNFRGNDLSEAEIRHVVAKVLEEKKMHYALEVPTKYPFKHNEKGNKKTTRRALFDMAIYASHAKIEKSLEPEIVIEFKRGQPQNNAPQVIRKDFIKMLGEPCKGAAFFHILTGKRVKSKTAHEQIIKKYNDAFNKEKNSKYLDKWFLLFILDLNEKRHYAKSFPHMKEFKINPKIWSELKWSN